MAQKKAHEVEAWLKLPDPNMTIVLFYGPDRGMVAQRAELFARSTGLVLDDPFAVLKIDAGDITGDPGRIIDELRTIPMFGGKRLVWIKNAASTRNLADIVRLVAAETFAQSLLLIESGDLKKGSPLRAAAESGRTAIALPCYGDDDRAIDAILDAELTKSGLSMTIAARQAFKAMLGGDRLATLGEIEKLMLYCHGGKTVEIEDVYASAGDVSPLSVDAIIDAVLTGNRHRYDLHFARQASAGANPFTILSALIRQLQMLQIMRSRVERDNKSASAIIASHRPPVFFARRNNVTMALGIWNSEAIVAALARLQETVLLTRTNAALASAASHRLLLSICLESSKLLGDRRN